MNLEPTLDPNIFLKDSLKWAWLKFVDLLLKANFWARTLFYGTIFIQLLKKQILIICLRLYKVFRKKMGSTFTFIFFVDMLF